MTETMKTNIATTQDQSRRLLACGVSADTADMHIDNYGELWASPYKDNQRKDEKGFTPVWSLSALLSIMPDLEHCFSLWKFEEDDTYAADATMVNPDFRVDANDPIEACVGLIEILHANGYKFNEI